MTEVAWAGSNPGSYNDTQWIRACVLDKGGTGTAKQRYALPVRAPDGGLDKQGVKSAMELINHVKGASPEALGTAARALHRAAAQVGLDPGEGLKPHLKK